MECRLTAPLCADSDIGYAAKPLWRSYMTILHDPQADASFQNEEIGMGPSARLTSIGAIGAVSDSEQGACLTL